MPKPASMWGDPRPDPSPKRMTARTDSSRIRKWSRCSASLVPIQEGAPSPDPKMCRPLRAAFGGGIRLSWCSSMIASLGSPLVDPRKSRARRAAFRLRIRIAGGSRVRLGSVAKPHRRIRMSAVLPVQR